MVRSGGWTFVAGVGDEQRADQERLGCRCDRLGATLEIVDFFGGRRGVGLLLGRQQKIGRTQHGLIVVGCMVLLLLHQEDLRALCLLLVRQFSRVY